jgi:hypothetical protein
MSSNKFISNTNRCLNTVGITVGTVNGAQRFLILVS